MNIFKRIKIHVIHIYNRLGKYIWKKPKIKSIDETLDYINEHHCSVSRFGDGEFAIIQGNYNGFQNYNSELGKKLSIILTNPIENHIVCLPDIFGDQDGLKSNSKIFNNGLLDNERRAWLNLLDINRVYYNAFFTRCYNMFENKSNSERWFNKNKKIWADKEILIIEGRYSRLGVGNDLFDGAKSIERILGPAENAFDKYDKIIELAKLYGKGKLILIALGMTATVLAYDLAKKGFWAIDIGHIDVEYEWYKLGVNDKVALKGKYVNEVPDGRKVSDENLPAEYWRQIVEVIE